MKYCPYCGNPLEDEMIFCNKCGKPFPILSDIDNNPANGPQRNVSYENQSTTTPPKKNGFLRVIIIILALAVACTYGWKYYQAYEAQKAAEAAAAAAAEAEKNYNNGVSYYNNGKYSQALTCFNNAGDSFPNIELYKILCNAHVYGDIAENDVKILCNNLDFMDTKTVLLATDDIALKFLTGFWSSNDDKYTFEVYSDKDNYHTQYRLPNDQPKDSDYFVIKDGIYYYHTPTDEIEGFRFTIYSKDRIAVFCYKDNSRIELFRKN